jgi:M6 family metalloprotease-like protein
LDNLLVFIAKTKLKNAKKIILCTVLCIMIFGSSRGAPISFEPVFKKLPDGSVLSLYVSGDEFFNWLHDNNGFPVGQGADGYFYYLIQDGEKFSPTSFRAGQSNPNSISGIRRVDVPSIAGKRRELWQKQVIDESAKKGRDPFSKSTGVLNNMVIYIKFAGEPDFTVSRSVYDSKLNNPAGPSVLHYYREVSYNQLDVVSYHLQGGAASDECYTDQYPRSYYQPYNEFSNPGGYKNDTERGTREHYLLANAVHWVSGNFTLPEGVDFDYDDNGEVDNICFIVRGSPDGWSELLWPHRWVLFYANASIGGLDVWGYTLQMESVSVTTFSHEMFHALGAPDLYHYNNSDSPVGPWDIMANGAGHPGAWMKYKYGNWLRKMTEINSSGTYVIKPLTDSSSSCYLLKSPYRSDQVFVIEFRRKTGLYESYLPSSGIIITRINKSLRGNANGPPDEIYVFRKDGSYMLPGKINSAEFSAQSGRTAFSDLTNPNAFFSDGSKTALNILNISAAGDSMTFTVEMDKPVSFTVNPEEDSRMYLSWKGWDKNYLVAVSKLPVPLKATESKSYLPGDTIGSAGTVLKSNALKYFQHTGLESDEQYYYTVWTITGTNPPSYSSPVTASARTGIYVINRFPYSENFDNSEVLPRGWKSSPPAGIALSSNNSFSGPNSLILSQENDPAYRLYTPGFDLLSSKTYLLSYRFRNIDPGTGEAVTLKAGLARTGNGSEILTIVNRELFMVNDWVIQFAAFRVGNSGIYYMGFQPGTGGKGILLDDIKLEMVPEGTKVSYTPAEFYPNPTAGRIIVPAEGKTTITVFRPDGKKVFEKAVEGTEELDLSYLGKGMYLVRFSAGKNITSGRLIIL